MTVRACPVCGSDPAPSPPKFLWEKDGYRIVRCGTCGLGFVENPPTANGLAQLYQEDYYEGEESQGYKGYGKAETRKRLHFSTLLDHIDHLRAPNGPGRLLEVGSAYGFFLSEAANRGWDVTGVELSAFAAAETQRRLEVPVFSSLEPLTRDAAGSFDVVAAWDVIEHVAQPDRLVRDAHGLLRPGGVLALSTGDFGSAAARLHGADWSLMTPPWHLWFFSRKALKRLLTRFGFEIASVEGDGTVLRDPASPRPRLRWADPILGWPPLAAVFRRLALGQIMTVYARKPAGPGAAG